MLAFPTLPQASDSFAYLAGLIRNPAKWDNYVGGNHLWTVQGYFQANFFEGPAEANALSEIEVSPGVFLSRTEAELKQKHPETIERAFDVLAAQGRGEAVHLAIGQGVLKLLVGKLVQQFLQSGLAEDLIRKLLGELLGDAQPG